MFWREHSYVAFSTTYVGYLTLHRKSAYLRREKISCSLGCIHERFNDRIRSEDALLNPTVLFGIRQTSRQDIVIIVGDPDSREEIGCTSGSSIRDILVFKKVD